MQWKHRLPLNLARDYCLPRREDVRIVRCCEWQGKNQLYGQGGSRVFCFIHTLLANNLFPKTCTERRGTTPFEVELSLLQSKEHINPRELTRASAFTAWHSNRYATRSQSNNLRNSFFLRGVLRVSCPNQDDKWETKLYTTWPFPPLLMKRNRFFSIEQSWDPCRKYNKILQGISKWRLPTFSQDVLWDFLVGSSFQRCETMVRRFATQFRSIPPHFVRDCHC